MNGYTRNCARHSTIRTAALKPTGAVTITGANERRVALTFTPEIGGAAFVVGTSPEVTVSSGLVVTPTGGSFCISVETHGDLVKQPWYAIAGSGVTIAFVDTTEE